MSALTRTSAALTLISALILLVSMASIAQAESLGAWSATTPYPSQLAGVGCALVSPDVYCVGGFDTNYNSYDDVNYATVNGSGIGAWSTGTAYPTAVDSASCVNSGSTIYCVGGEDGQAAIDNVYYSQISSSGAPGAWSAAATYPEATVATSCVVYAGYVYCVGGYNGNGDEVSSSYYATLGSPGIDSWTSTTAYPKALDSESCVASAGYIFCVAGEVDSNGNENTPINSVYYAQLMPSGIGAWSAGPAYPASLAALSCAPYSGYVYCVGGFDINGLSNTDAYYAPVSSSGVGSWTGTTPYPVAIDTSSCVAAAAYMYCVGGVNGLSSTTSNVNDANYAPLGTSTSSTSSTAPEFPVAAALPLTLAVGLGAASMLGLRRRKDRA